MKIADIVATIIKENMNMLFDILCFLMPTVASRVNKGLTKLKGSLDITLY